MSTTSKVYLAVDLGASSGRVVAGLFDGKRLELEEVHRFENGGVWANDRLYWDLLRQWRDVQQGLRAAAAKFGSRVASVGVDTWGVDFGLLGRNDELLVIRPIIAIRAPPACLSGHSRSVAGTRFLPRPVCNSWN